MTELIIKNQEEHELREKNDTISLMFWVYLMTDLVMFAVLFACYAVLHTSTFGGPTTHELFNLKFVLVETLLLLTSSFTMGLTMLAVQAEKKWRIVFGLLATAILGWVFLYMEVFEFGSMIQEGATFTRSAFLSSYFTLVGTHGVHIAVGLLWIIIMILWIIRRGLSPSTARKLTLLSLFWHFLDIVWIFIFTMVYLMGTLH